MNLIARVLVGYEASRSWITFELVIWTVAIGFVVFAAIVLLPPLALESWSWCQETFGSTKPRAKVLDFQARRRQYLNAAVRMGGR